jgi:hypothetical protein
MLSSRERNGIRGKRYRADLPDDIEQTRKLMIHDDMSILVGRPVGEAEDVRTSFLNSGSDFLKYLVISLQAVLRRKTR